MLDPLGDPCPDFTGAGVGDALRLRKLERGMGSEQSSSLVAQRLHFCGHSRSRGRHFKQTLLAGTIV